MKSTILPVLFLLVITSLGVSCKKKDIQPENQDPATEACDTTFVNNYINDTIFPSDYLMTYPGSEWHYDNGSTVTCDAWENIAIAATTTSGNCVTVTKDYHFVPHCSSSPYYIAYNKELVAIANGFKTKPIPLIDTIVGASYYDNYSFAGWQSPYEITHVDQYFTVVEKLESYDVLSVTYPDVVHVRLQIHGYNNHSEGTTVYHSYYAKNVGLIRSYTGDNPDPGSEKKLVSYTIGPH